MCNTEFDLSRMSKQDQPCLHHTHMRIIKEHVACKDFDLRYIIERLRNNDLMAACILLDKAE